MKGMPNGKDKSLVYISNSMSVLIENYSEYKFEYNNWIVSDNYVFNESIPRHSNYSIAVASPTVKTEQELHSYESFGRNLMNRITSLIPLSGLPPLIQRGNHDFFSNKSIFVTGSLPNGWRSNYKEVKKRIIDSHSSDILMDIEFMGLKSFSIINYSPLREIEVMVNNINNIGEEINYLVFLNNSIMSSVDSNVFMLIGKALEIIDAMYPLKTKKDRRIEEHFPELSNIFNNCTIKDLINWSNNRREARHFVRNKSNLTPHEPLNNEERTMMYKCATCLITNVIRDKFGLLHFSFNRI